MHVSRYHEAEEHRAITKRAKPSKSNPSPFLAGNIIGKVLSVYYGKTRPEVLADD